MTQKKYLLKENGKWMICKDLCEVRKHFFTYLYNYSLYQPGSNMRNYIKSEIIIAGGRGIQKIDDFRLLNILAYYLCADIGVSRPLVDQGWFPKTMQMGINGQKINPDLYFAIGISGKFQHMVGPGNARHFIAINTDKNAEIFEKADLGIVGDYKEIISYLLYAFSQPSI